MTVVGFGDSITLACEVDDAHKWLNILERKLRQRDPGTEWTVINAGVGGNTSREGLARMAQDVLVHRPAMVLVEFGGNDATEEPARHVSLEEYGSNLQAILDGLNGIDARMALVMFPPVIDEWHCWGNQPYYTLKGGVDRYIEEYRKVTRKFAQDHHLPLADINAALRRAYDRFDRGTFIRPDGVHLTEGGNQVVAETVFETLDT